LENLDLLGESKGDAAFYRVADVRAFRGSAWDIDEMPAAGFGVGFAVIVGPCGGVFDWIGRNRLAIAVERRVDRIIGKDLIHHRQRMGVEVSPGDEGDCLVTFASPGERARTMQKTGTKYKDENRETSGFQFSTSVYCFYFATILFG
jgi:hypothetical protein